MSTGKRTANFQVVDMTCVSCEHRIEKKLKETPGVFDAKASFSDGTVRVDYDDNKVDADSLKQRVESLDYRLATDDTTHAAQGNTGLAVACAIVALYGLYAFLDRFDLLNVFYRFPQAETGMGYGMLFLVGALTSAHCVAMCGGINLSQSLKNVAIVSSSKDTARFPAPYSGFLYNAGRLASYTLIGGVVGLFGATITPSASARGFIQIVAGVFMVVMGLNLLNVFPWLRRVTPRLPGICGRSAAHVGKNPLYVGLANGFMPCGPLQAMQLYALSTGGFIKGALSMAAFGAGTLPLMLGLSAIVTLLSKKLTRAMMTTGAAMVIVFGVALLGNGTSLAESAFSAAAREPDARAVAPTGGVPATSSVRVSEKPGGMVQQVRTELKPSRYDPITVQVGIPVRWTIFAAPGTLNGCNNQIVLPEYNGLQKQLRLGENVIEFTPTRAGNFVYTCWMGMIRGKITVIEGDAGNPKVKAETLSPLSSAEGKQDGNIDETSKGAPPENRSCPRCARCQQRGRTQT